MMLQHIIYIRVTAQHQTIRQTIKTGKDKHKHDIKILLNRINSKLLNT